MALTYPTESTALQLLLGAFTSGSVSLVDEHARPLTFKEGMGTRCWAHLTDAQDGQVYVQELPGSEDLLQPRYLELLGLKRH